MQTIVFILHIYTPSCAMFLHIVCALATFHIIILYIHTSYDTSWSRKLQVHREPFSMPEVNKLPADGVDLFAFVLSISTITQSRRIAVIKNIESLMKHHICTYALWCQNQNIHIQFISAVQACQHEFDCSEILTATLMCFIHKCQPRKALNQVSVR